MSDLDFVRSLARHLCNDPHDADDVAQDAMVRALEKRPVDVGSWRGWLTVVTRNLARNRRRGERRREVRELAMAADLSVPSASEVAAQEQLRKHVVDAVMELPVDFRSVVLLRHYRGMDTRECAKHLGILESTVRTRLKRGVDRLRERLDQEHGDRATWVSGLVPFVMMDTKRAALAGGLGGGKVALVLAALLLVASSVVVWSSWSSASAPPPSMGAANAGEANGALAAVGNAPDGGNADADTEGAAVRSMVADANAAPWRVDGIVRNREVATSVVAGATVRMWLGPVGSAYPVLSEVRETSSDAAGRFVFSLEELRAQKGNRQRLAVFVGVDADGYRPAWAQAVWLGDYVGGVEKTSVTLEPGVFCKGRIVDVAGVPLRDASLLMIVGETQHRVKTDTDGRYVIDSLLPEQYGYDRVLFGIHDAHGFSGAHHVRIRADGDTKIPDLVVANPLGLLHGHVRDPNGNGVADVELTATRLRATQVGLDDDAYSVDGIRIRRFVDVTAGAGANRYRAKTDADGYFRFCTMRPGVHRVAMRGQRGGQEVTVAAVTDPVAFVLGDASIKVRAVDERGVEARLGVFAIYKWTGAKAVAAARRFASVGPSRELLRTGERTSALRHADRLMVTPNTFVVIEHDDPAIGASYGSCYLGPDTYGGEAVVRVVAGKRTGSLRVVARDAGGESLQPVLVKCCRVAGVRAVPIRGLGRMVADPQDTMILGDWVEVPSDGKLSGLPTGDLTFEVMAGADLRGRQVVTAPFLQSVHEVVVDEEAVGDLVVGAERGIPLTFDLRLPKGHEAAVGSIHFVEVFLNASDGSRNLKLKLAADSGGAVKFVNGHCRLHSQRPAPKGTYAVSVIVNPGFGSGPSNVTLHPGVGAIPIQLTR